MSGGNTTTSTTSQPPAAVTQAYGNLTNAAFQQAQQPLQTYSAPLVSGFTPQQQAGFKTIDNSQGVANPYINSAAQEFGAATTPLWQNTQQYTPQNVNQYLSPYTSDVTGALTNLYNQQNAQQQQQVASSAVGQGAYGGDRQAVAQALTAQQENLAQAPTLAQVEQQGFQGAQGELNTQQQQQLSANQANAWLASQAAFGLGSLGTEAQNTALTGANAEIGAGGMQQQLAQEQLNIPYQEFQQQQAYPYQQLSFLAPIVEGTGSLSGGTGTTTSPGPTAASQIAGLGLAGVGAYGLYNNLTSGGSGLSSGLNAIGSAFDSGSASTGLDAIGDAFGKRGGRFAAGGMAIPTVPGIGTNVPSVNLSYIPQPAPGGTSSPLGLSPFQPVVTTTQDTSGGGLNDIIGALGAAVKIGSLFGAKTGGRIGYDQGGGIGTPGTIAGLPQVPQLSLDYITKATSGQQSAAHGAGPPHPPNAMPGDDPMKDAQGLSSAMGQIGKTLTKSSGDTSGGFAEGGGIGHLRRQAAGQTTQAAGQVPLAVASQFGGAPPNVTGMLQQLMQMPLNRLQEMAVQFPPNTQQGQMVARAIAMKQATPGSGTTPVQGPQYGGGMGAAATGSASGTASAATAPQDFSGTAHTMATGGAADERGYVTPDELDPHPVVDHSGDSVKIRYPSEGKVLDLGLPPIKPARGNYAAGGSSGSDYPQVSFSNGAWSTSNPSLGAATQPPINPAAAQFAGISPSFSTGTGGGGSSFQAANGVNLPLLGTSPTAGGISQNASSVASQVQPGGGVGNWMQPLPQLTQFGTGPGGTTEFPNSTAFEPQMAGIIQAFGNTPPAWANGKRGGRFDDGGVVGNGGLDPGDLPAAAPFTDPMSGELIAPLPGTPPTSLGIGQALKDIYVTNPPRDTTPHPLISGGPTQDTSLKDMGVAAPVASKTAPEPSITDTAKVVPTSPTEMGIGAPHQDISLTPTGGLTVSPGQLAAGASDLRAPLAPPTEPSATPAAATAPAAAPPVAPKAGIHVTGDSQGWGLNKYGGLLGTTSDHPEPLGNPTLDAAIGRSPRDEYTYIQKKAAEGYWKGKDVVLTTGVQNDPSQVGFVPWQIQALKDAGANVVGIAGFTPTGAKGTPMGPTAEEVSRFAQEKGVPFGGMFAADIRPKDPVHLTAEGYKKVGAWYNQGATQRPPGPVDQLVPNGNAPQQEGATSPSGAPKSFVDAQIGLESGNRINAHNPMSSAAGPGQFINSTWLSVLKAHHPDIAAGKSDEQLLALRTDPQSWDLNRQMVADYRTDNAVALRSAGIEPTDGLLSVAHTLGPEGAIAVYRAAPGTSLASLMPAAAVAANPWMKGMTTDRLLSDRNTMMQSATAAGHGTQPGGDQIVGPGTGKPGIEGGGGGIGPQVNDISHQVLDRTPPEHRSGMQAWMNSPYYLAFLTGAGMLASRSHFPGVALGQGLEFAAKGMENQQAQDYRNQIAETRMGAASDRAANQAALVAERATNNENTLNFKYANLLRQQQQGDNSLALRTEIAATKSQLDQAQLQVKQAALEVSRYKATRDRPGYDPASGQAGVWRFNPDKGTDEFIPGPTVGVSHAASTYQQMHDAWLKEHPGDTQGALNYAAKQSGFRDQVEFEHEVATMIGHLQSLPAYVSASPNAVRGAAEQMVLQERSHAPGTAPATPTTQPTQAAPAGPPPAAIDYLRAHPDQRGAFDQKYGAGASTQVLGAP